MTDLTNHAENGLVDHVAGTAAFGSPASVWVQLHDGPPGEDGTAKVIAGVARLQATFAAAVGGIALSAADIEWTGMPACVVRYWTLWTAETLGDPLYQVPLGVNVEAGFSANASTETFTAYGHGLSDDDPVVFYGSNLPAPIVEETVFYVVNATADTFQVAADKGGVLIPLTSEGNGVVRQIQEKIVNAGDAFRLPTGQLSISLD